MSSWIDQEATEFDQNAGGFDRKAARNCGIVDSKDHSSPSNKSAPGTPMMKRPEIRVFISSPTLQPPL